MTEHTPSTTDIRIRYERYREQEHQRGADGVTPVTPGEFDRWLAAEVAAKQAEALREVAATLAEFCAEPWNRHLPAIRLLHLRADEIERTTDER